MRSPLLAMGTLVICLVGSSPGLAGEPTLAGAAGAKGGLGVEQLVFCAAIKDRSPAGVADTFPADIYSVYCFTRVVGAVGAGDTTVIRHLWYRGETIAAERRLVVRSSPWRTWSAKEMRKDWKGDWRVDVVASDGTVLASKKFYLR